MGRWNSRGVSMGIATPAVTFVRVALDVSGRAWNKGRVKALRVLWAEGWSANEIARELGGVSRNAVIGKVHRLRLNGRIAPARPSRRVVRQPPACTRIHTPPPRARAPVAKPPRTTAVEALAPLAVEGARVGVLTLGPGMCRYPIGDPKEPGFGFCARAVEGVDVYCAAHALVCRARAPPRPVKPLDLRRLDEATALRNRSWV